MENCFIKNYQSELNNNNLPVFGKAKIIQLSNEKAFQLRLSVGGTANVMALEGTFDATFNQVTSYNQTDYTITNNTGVESNIAIKATSDNTVIYVDKYGVALLGYDAQGNNAALKANISELSYMTTVAVQGVNSYVTGNAKLSDFEEATVISLIAGNGDASLELDVENADLSSITSLLLGKGCNAKGNIDGFTAPLLSGLTLQYQEQVSCNVETLNLPTITSLNITASTNIVGDLKDWALAMWNNGNGRTSGFCKVSYIDGYGVKAGVLWNGQDLYVASGAYQPRIHFSASGVGISSSDTPPSSFISE